MLTDNYSKSGVRVVDMGSPDKAEKVADASEEQTKAAATEIFQLLTSASRKAASMGDSGKALERAIDAARDVAHRIR